MKKLLSLMLVAILLVSAVPFQASAAEDVAAVASTTYTVLVQVKLDGSDEVAETIKIENVEAGQTLYVDRIASRVGYEFAGIEGAASAANNTYTVSNDATVVVKLNKLPEETTAPTEAHTHAYTGAVTTAATCTDKGFKTYTCSCGDSYTEDIAATGHTWDKGVVTTAATVSSTGVKTYTCTVCSAQKNETIEKLSNDTSINDNTAKILTVVLDLNYEGSQDYYLYLENNNIKWADIFAQIEDEYGTFSRDKYTFAGWYWDDDYDYKCKDNEYVSSYAYDKVRVYAKWTRKSAEDNTYLYLYTNGKTSSASKIIDVSAYGDADSKISLSEALTVARKYYTFSGYDGVYTEESWNGGAYDNSTAGSYVAVNAEGDTIVYLMIWNASTSSSSTTTTTTTTTSKADSSNPTTGDQIFVAVTVMAVSAAALVGVYFYMKKRRAV